MRFGQFLINAGALTPEQLLAVLTEQEKRRDSKLRVAVAYGLDVEAVLNAAERADERGEAFLQAARSSGLIGTSDAAAITKAWQKTAPPLGELAVEFGMLREEERQQLFIQYLQRYIDTAHERLATHPVEKKTTGN